jgi:hypothetical protein
VRQLFHLSEDKRVLGERIQLLEREIPWGVKRASNHLVGQIKSKFQRTMAGSSGRQAKFTE